MATAILWSSGRLHPAISVGTAVCADGRAIWPPGSAETAPATTDTTTSSDDERSPPLNLRRWPRCLWRIFLWETSSWGIGRYSRAERDQRPDAGTALSWVFAQRPVPVLYRQHQQPASCAGCNERRLAAQIAEDVSPLFPPAWNADNQQIAYVSPTDQTDPNGMPVMELRSVAVRAVIVLLASFVLTGDCSTTFTIRQISPILPRRGRAARNMY